MTTKHLKMLESEENMEDKSKKYFNAIENALACHSNTNSRIKATKTALSLAEVRLLTERGKKNAALAAFNSNWLGQIKQALIIIHRRKY